MNEKIQTHRIHRELPPMLIDGSHVVAAMRETKQYEEWLIKVQDVNPTVAHDMAERKREEYQEALLKRRETGGKIPGFDGSLPFPEIDSDFAKWKKRQEALKETEPSKVSGENFWGELY